MTSSESDNESDDNYSDIVYDPEEPNYTRFTIALCDLYNVNIHGPNHVDGHYIVHCRYKKLHMNWIHETIYFMHVEYQQLHTYHHNVFPNYRQIVLQENYIKPEIVECIVKNDCCLAIIKTFWIKIIQRAWKNVLENRNKALKNRETIQALRHRELTGKWPTYCHAKGGVIGFLKSTRSS